MFSSNSHMPQVLDASAYYSREQYEREVERLMLPAWHVACTQGELADDGDYLTRDVLGRPVIFWRTGGEVRAFLNVCAHRSCKLTDDCHGNFPRLQCQYHGWEYDERGNTRRIPDAKSFRPMEPGIVGLRSFRTETVGQLIFFTMNDDAPPLAEYLGPGYALCRELFDDTWKCTGPSDRQIDCNWKCYIENTVESYHVETVHPTTLKQMPSEETCTHEFDDRWSLLRTSGKEGRLDYMDRIAHRVLGVDRDPDYWNMLIYPNLVMGKMSLFGWIDETLPLGPNRMQVFARGFTRIGRPGPLPAVMRFLVRRWGRRFFTKLVAEDAAVLKSVQLGLESPEQPPGGLISTREERVFHFQNYIQRTTGDAAPSHKQAADETTAAEPGTPRQEQRVKSMSGS